MKRLFRSLSPLFFCILFYALFCSFEVEEYAYNPLPNHPECVMTDTLQNIASLKAQYGKNKTIPVEIERECLLALSHFPELQETEIVFTYKTIKFTMQTQPQLNFIFRKKQNRAYKIEMNNNAKAYTGLDYHELSLNAKIGWFGHELSHICDYEQMNNAQLIGLGLGYPFDSFKKKVERRVDLITIKHGLGKELYEGINYLHNHSCAYESYKKAQKAHYLSLEEIAKETQRLAK
jgi:hypothetical protein